MHFNPIELNGLLKENKDFCVVERFFLLFQKPFLFFVFVFLYDISTVEGYLMPNPSLSKKSSGTIQPIGRELRIVYVFPKSGSLIISRLEFELAY